jgi:hypothetical protein
MAKASDRNLRRKPERIRQKGALMKFQQKAIWTSLAILIILTLVVPSTAAAQARGGGGQAPAAGAQPQGGGGAGGGAQGGRGGRGGGAQQYTPAAGAKDLKAVMFNWGWYTGMLRSSEEYDILMTLEYQGRARCKWTDSPAI